MKFYCVVGTKIIQRSISLWLHTRLFFHNIVMTQSWLYSVFRVIAKDPSIVFFKYISWHLRQYQQCMVLSELLTVAAKRRVSSCKRAKNNRIRITCITIT